ncbi:MULTISPECIES: DUF3857 domain-containing protein [unclassified Polaribacter]|uniref:DUF3857 domain-containing protein n=1 Tax=unclassified Polaribacter TaxID=196858 RepID=UPI0011BE670E|nr:MULTISPECIES: DUF3857 domain-containing protein [unclassified Polaribacter]TXD53394.1 DUF3857 domain-containing protein [Polaribacter sp. IC063]TXD61504.1 DUF3857 domain-containing protein [Polaribacter sp. IC066]
MEKYTKLKRFKLSLLIVFIGLIPEIQAQYSQDFNTYSTLYPESTKVRLQQEMVITITADKGEISIKQEILEEDLFLNESATYNSKNSLNFSSFFELDKIEASSYSYENDTYVETAVEKFTEKDELDESFYDDSTTLSFIYSNLKKGSKAKLKYSQIIKNPRFLSPFYFGDYFPVIKNKITIIADKDITLNFKEFNIKEGAIKFTKEEKRKSIIYIWEANNKDKYEFEVGSPSYKTFLPHIVPIITSYKVKKETKKVLGEVSDLYNWYYSLVENINTESPDAELIALVKEITADKKTELEKVKAIYYWTQKNIKYIAFEYALGGFIPRESNDVFKKKYGDCKDNSSILYSMLKIAGIKGNLTWIGTRSIPYTYEEVPTPVVDNHMILSYENEGQTYYLDATGRYIKFGLPTSFIQGKEALVSYGKDFKIKKVPVVAAKENALIDSTTIKIKNGIIAGSSKTAISGYLKIDYFNALENDDTETKLKQFYNNTFSKGNNKFLIKSFQETNKYDYDKDFIVAYSFEIDNYAKKLGDEIYINLNLNKDLSSFKTDKKRKTAIEYEYKRQYNYTTTLEIPEGYKVDYIPESVSFSTKLLTSKISYVLAKNHMVYTHTITLDFLVLSLEEQQTVNAEIKKIEKNYKEIVVLKKI